jgi:predicted Zn-dependent protease
MIAQIKRACKSAGIDRYRIYEKSTVSAELFFVKQTLNTSRICQKCDSVVTVYREFTNDDGRHCLGSATANIPAAATDMETVEKLKKAYTAAGYVQNKYYELPGPELSNTGDTYGKESEEASFDGMTPEQAAGCMAAAIFSEKNDNAFVNSAEVYAIDTYVHIINSEGIDVSYNKQETNGEIAVQSKLKEDVEIFREFYYSGIPAARLRSKVAQLLSMAADRSVAVPFKYNENKNGDGIPVIITGEAVGSLMRYYVDRAWTDYIYPHYSDYEVGKDIQAAGRDGCRDEFDRIDIKLESNVPYDNDGIYLKNIHLVEDGILKAIHGGPMFSYYMGIKPTGTYISSGLSAEPGVYFSMPAGRKCAEELESGRFLKIVSFSDFQADSITGEFGGEFRLAYYSDGEKVVPVTGGTLSGTVNDVCSFFEFSRELQDEFGFRGPSEVRFRKAMVGSKQ